MAKEHGGLEEIEWKCLVLGDHQPQEFSGGKWVSSSNEEYPIDIVLGLKRTANIYKVVIEVDELFTRDDTLERNYKNARLAAFSEPVKMEFDGKMRISSRMEAKNAFMNSAGQYIWIIVYEPEDLHVNPRRKVCIKKMAILGYPLPNDELAALNNKFKISGDNSRKSSAASRTSSTSSVQYQNPELGRYSYNGDGMYFGSSGLGGDPLTTIRLVKKVLKNKMEKVNQENREVEGTVCLRATQRLSEYEKMLEELSQKRSNALVHNETQQAERIMMAMVDCRDTVLRAVHIDLLLGREEVGKSVFGKQSS
ncbi:hypothetical protein RB195_018406 [Necator americanus]|uniref:Uncharacterized protein n=1 Tax=Necator americanus TaxID=51031 RepID=A0ABR1CAT0_NECAM